MRRTKYLDWEQAFHFIWQNTDRDGIWHGDAASLAEEFDALHDVAESILDELRDRRLIERLSVRTYFISGWREREDTGCYEE
jgi:hypothetical protein